MRMPGQRQILLIQPPNVEGTLFNLPGTEIPLSLLYLAAYTAREGLPADLLDLTLERDPFSVVSSFFASHRPRIVGITSYTTNAALASRLAGQVKSLSPETFVVLGGFHASALPEQSMEEFPDLDAVVYGEGEKTFSELAESVLAGTSPEKIPGLCYRDGGQIRKTPARALVRDLDSLPYPARDLISWDRYVPDPGNYFALPSTGILFSRGCPFRCTYCSKGVFLNRIRYRSEEKFLDEIQDCMDRYGIRDFRFFDEGPTHSRKRILSLCRKILQRGLRITWNCYSRVDAMDEEILEQMRAAGCYHIKYGIESGVPETLEKIGKPTDLDRAVAVCRATRRAGIECKANFMLGFPWEGVPEIEQTIRYAKRCAPDLATFNLLKPFPGSRLYDDLRKSGRLLPRPWEDYFTTSETLLFDTDIPEEAYRKLLKKAWFSFYLRPSFLWQRLGRLRRSPRRELQNAWTGVRFFARNLLQF